MTSEEIKKNGEILLNAINAAYTAYEAYRVAKGKKYLELSYPTDGSKKPTEGAIAAYIDSDPGLAELRVEADRRAAIVTVAKLVFQAETAAMNTK
jgi:hypothetical protein